MPLFRAGVFDSEGLHMLNRGHRNGLSNCRLGCQLGSRFGCTLFFFFCNTSPKPQLQCSQEASPIYIESPTSPSQGSAGWQAGVTAAAGRCKVVNYATKWTSQKWSPHTPCPGAVADNLGVLSGRVPVLSGYPIIRGKQRYIGRETRGTGGGGGGVAVGDQGAVGRPQGKEENGIPLAWCRGGGRCTMGGPTCQRLAKKIETQRGIGGAHRRVHGRGGRYYTQLAVVLCWT